MIELERVTFTYDGANEPTLREMNVQIASGEMVAVLGAQGSGTSTLCRMMAGLLDRHGHLEGRITRMDGAPAMLGDDPEAQLTGMVSTVADEVRLPGRLSGLPESVIGQRAAATMDHLGIGALAHRHTGTLSGGERQLTALASLLTLSPSLLVLDQPGLALDAGARRQLRAALRAHCEAGGSVVLASHQHDDLTATCDRALLLESGQIRQQGTVDDLNRDQVAACGIWQTPAHGELEPRSTKSSAPDPKGGGEPAALSAVGLGVDRDGLPVLHDLAFSAVAGSVTVVLGPNGSGKSTLLRALAGLLPHRRDRVRGEITAGTELLTRVPAAHRARHIGWVGQDPGAQLSASTVLREMENALPPVIRRQDRIQDPADRSRRIAEILELTELSDAAVEHPYDLSLSQRKDLVIATALLMEPKVLLLDEPTLGRDGPAMHLLTRLVSGVADRGGAVVLTTHDHAWAQDISDQLFTLEQGRLVAMI